MKRREFMLRATAGFAAGAIVPASVSFSAENGKNSHAKPIRVALIGCGGRGNWILRCLVKHVGGVSVPAVCDLIKQRAVRAADEMQKATGKMPETYCGGDEYEYRKMCERDDIDAVLVATEIQKLARISADVMKAGKHVGAEVSGACTLEDCWSIVKAKESSGKHYMLLENCSYGNENMAVLNMVKQGVFGEPYFAECSYVHDARTQMFGADGSIRWRGELARDHYGSHYPSHGIGSVSKWFGLNEGDRMVSCETMQNDPLGVHDYVVKKFGADSELAKVHFKRGDFVSTTIRTAKGKLIRLDQGGSSTRPYSRYYLLQGLNGCYSSRDGIYVQGTSKSHQWEKFAPYLSKYQHDYWRESGKKARSAGGHGGIDYHCMCDFADMVRNHREPWIDVYDSAAWASISACSRLSLDQNSAPVEMPDFTGGRWKDPSWRKDNYSPV